MWISSWIRLILNLSMSLNYKPRRFRGRFWSQTWTRRPKIRRWTLLTHRCKAFTSSTSSKSTMISLSWLINRLIWRRKEYRGILEKLRNLSCKKVENYKLIIVCGSLSTLGGSKLTTPTRYLCQASKTNLTVSQRFQKSFCNPRRNHLNIWRINLEITKHRNRMFLSRTHMPRKLNSLTTMLKIIFSQSIWKTAKWWLLRPRNTRQLKRLNLRSWIQKRSYKYWRAILRKTEC